MEYRAIEPGIEVNGQTVFSVVDGFGAFTRMGSRYLLDEGIGEPEPDGSVRVERERWYSQEAWLRAFERIGKELGGSALHLIGLKIPANAIFPPWVVDIDSALRSIDVAYHLNHRKQGQVMFDVAAGTMLEGIGHYGFSRDPAAKRILCGCDNPYPCDFDAGIVASMARRFVEHARVEHDPAEPCRKRGADRCTYVVSW
jgi:hypothetical protein